MALIGDAKQATGEGKSGPVETGVTGLVATALDHGSHQIHDVNVTHFSFFSR